MFKKILFVFSSFMFSLSIVSAKDLAGALYTSNEYRPSGNVGSINLFEELNNKTAFANYLFNYGNDFAKNLAIKTGDFDISHFSDDVNYSIFSASEFFENPNNLLGSNGIKNFECLIDDVDSDCSGKLFSSYMYDDFGYDDIDYVIVVSANYHKLTISDDNFILQLCPLYIYYLNSTADLVGYVRFSFDSAVYSWNFIELNFINYTGNSTIDITSWYAYLFKFNQYSNTSDSAYNSTWYYDKIYPFNFFLDSSNAIHLENNSGYSGLSGWINNLFSKYTDVDKYNLNFIYNHVFYKSSSDFVSMYYYWFDDDSVVVPNNFTYKNVSDYSKGFYLIPRSGCDYQNYYLYYNNSDSLSVHSLYFNYYKYDYDLSDLVLVNQVNMYSSTAFVNYSYNPFVDLDINVNSDISSYYDYVINVSQIGDFNEYLLYYNSNCYYDITDLSYDDTIVFGEDTYIFTSAKKNGFYSSDNINSNLYSGSFIPSRGSSNSSVASSSEVPKINGGTSSSTGSLSDILSDVTGFVSGIFGSITALVSITAIFLNGLPPFILGAFNTIFVLGLVLLIIKVLR